ncbi:hypothetical protein YDYSY3_61060 [Paenibacillus chitinolyticus]|nr:hypothetical protein YDYSY3_61060 [Paenibacillus chitinolyticus]
MIESAPGVNGDYRLARKKDDITFLDIIHAIESFTREEIKNGNL